MQISKIDLRFEPESDRNPTMRLKHARVEAWVAPHESPEKMFAVLRADSARKALVEEIRSSLGEVAHGGRHREIFVRKAESESLQGRSVEAYWGLWGLDVSSKGVAEEIDHARKVIGALQSIWQEWLRTESRVRSMKDSEGLAVGLKAMAEAKP